MNHPCKDCRTYIEPADFQGMTRCPVIKAEITNQACNMISATHAMRAQRLMRQTRYRIVKEELRKAGLQGVRLL